LLGFIAFPNNRAATAQSDMKKVCKIGMTVNTLEPDGNTMSCRALGLQASAESYQIGCQTAQAEDAVMLTAPIHINDKSARLTTSSLGANTDNAKHAPEKLQRFGSFVNSGRLWQRRAGRVGTFERCPCDFARPLFLGYPLQSIA
jgi:hypothetical protein